MDWNVKHYPQYWGETKLAYPEVPVEHPRFAQSMVVGNLVFASGCTGQGSGAGEQVKLALDNARAALETAGSSMQNIIKTFFLVTSLDDYAEVRKTETEYYEKHAPLLVEKPPAATLMVVPSLARPEFLAEYEVIAAIDREAADWGVTYYPEYWGGKELAYPHVPKEHAKFARTQVAGNLVIVSGCQALDHDSVRVETSDIAEQSEIVLEKIRIGMEETGGDLSSVAKTNVFVKDADALAIYREVERAYLQKHSPEAADHPPASTAFIVAELPRPEFLIEVEAFGVIDKELPDFSYRHHPGTETAAMSVSAGNLVFLSGCDGTDAETGEMAGDGIEEQVTAALEKVRAALERAGSGLDRVVKLEVMLKRLEDYPGMRRAEFDYFEKHAPGLLSQPPASTLMQLPVITSPGALFQIDVTAVL